MFRCTYIDDRDTIIESIYYVAHFFFSASVSKAHIPNLQAMPKHSCNASWFSRKKQQ